MKYTKPHLSPELRAQITPHNRRDVRFMAAGVFFMLASTGLMYNLWPKKDQTYLVNNKTLPAIAQSDPLVLGASTQATPEAPPSAPDFTQYTVKAGDTLFNISQKYNVRWDSIAQINNLSEPFLLHGGQTLKIPQATTSKVLNKVYTIKPNETLVMIAKQFNITVDDIIAVNPNLQQSDLITAGQIIKLP